jgi:hypothetical protein
MKEYHDEIRRALEHAPFYGEQPAAFITNADLYAHADEISQAPDIFFIDTDFLEEQPPYRVISDSAGEAPEELRKMMEAARDLAHMSWSDDEIGEIVEHERAHFKAGQELHARDERAFLDITRNKDLPDFVPGSPLFQASMSPSMKTTKLGWASFYAHPAEPSAGDMRAIHSLGMVDAFDVAVRVQERNADSGPDNPDPDIVYPSPKMYTADEIQDLLAQMPERFRPHWNPYYDIGE